MRVHEKSPLKGESASDMQGSESSISARSASCARRYYPLSLNLAEKDSILCIQSARDLLPSHTGLFLFYNQILSKKYLLLYG